MLNKSHHFRIEVFVQTIPLSKNKTQKQAKPPVALSISRPVIGSLSYQFQRHNVSISVRSYTFPMQQSQAPQTEFLTFFIEWLFC
jgi:hypothetical protein